MPKETIASVRAGIELKILQLDAKLKDAERSRDQALAGLQDIAKAREEAVSRAMRATTEMIEAKEQRDTLRGFIMREIPVKLAELPAPIANALGVYGL